MSKICFGVDIGGTTVKIGIISTIGKIIDKWEIKTRTEDKGRHILDDIADSIENAIETRKRLQKRGCYRRRPRCWTVRKTVLY